MSHTTAIQKNIEYLPVIYLTQSMRELYQKGRYIAWNRHLSLLISGESGTGKELLAKSIHYNTAPNASFVTINCLDLPFDHFQERIEGCFTHPQCGDPPNDSDGAEIGAPTLFLRDIGKLDEQVQGSLLRFLKEQILQRDTQGEDRARVIFSYNYNGVSRAIDAFIRESDVAVFNPFLLNIMPLRDRHEDIRPLATFFCDKFAKEYDKEIGGIHSAAIRELEAYPWPGNVSELRDVMENAVLLAQSPLITREDIRFNISKKSIALESFLSREDFFTLEELDRIYIQTVLRRVRNNKSKAARILGVSRNTLQRKMKEFSDQDSAQPQRKKTGHQPGLF